MSRQFIHHTDKKYGCSQLLELTARSYFDPAGGLPRLRSVRLDFFHNVHAVNDGAKNHVLSVKPRRFRRADEELGAVGVGTSVGHAQDTCGKKKILSVSDATC